MASPVETHVSEKTGSEVQVIDIEYDVEDIIETVIEKPDDVSMVKIQVDEVPQETRPPPLLINESDNVSNTDPKSDYIAEAVQKVRDSFNRGVTRPILWRRRQLQNLLRMFEENIDTMYEALWKDLRRCKLEASIPELDLFVNDLKSIIYHLDEWAKPEKPQKDLPNLLDDVLIYKEPYGVALIIATWNYPILLLLMPASGAIAAGNAVVLKPSELTVACTKFLVETVPKYLDPEAITLIEGGPENTTELLKQKFDYILYTGSKHVGRKVYEAAAKHLTPVTLELGGKCPVYIDNTVEILVTAKRLLFGKLLNVGQTCIAPDYVLCTKEVQDNLVKASKKILRDWYGENPQTSPDLARIINDRHFRRLQAIIDACKDKIVIGGRYDAKEKFIEPTIFANVTASDEVMQEELFGPLMPIMLVKDANEAIEFINNRDKPLVLHVFSNIASVQSNFTNNTSSGQLCINETVVQVTVEPIPFGGVGGSGMGAYHGKISYDTFTHRKGCLKKNFFVPAEKVTGLRYPPYTENKLQILRFLLRKRHFPALEFLPYVLMFAIGAGLSYGICSWQNMDSDDL